MKRKENYFEIIVGSFVLLCAAWFFFNSLRSSKIKDISGFAIIANFDDASGIETGSDVKISGVKIGSVENYSLNEKNYKATIKMQINDEIKLPIDSSAKIASSGLLGEKYIEISPGSDQEFLKENDEIAFTQSSVNFEELLGKFIFNGEKKNENKND